MQKRRILEDQPGMRVLEHWVQAPSQLPLYPGQDRLVLSTLWLPSPPAWLGLQTEDFTPAHSVPRLAPQLFSPGDLC